MILRCDIELWQGASSVLLYGLPVGCSAAQRDFIAHHSSLQRLTAHRAAGVRFIEDSELAPGRWRIKLSDDVLVVTGWWVLGKSGPEGLALLEYLWSRHGVAVETKKHRAKPLIAAGPRVEAQDADQDRSTQRPKAREL